jgi:hypothetical protein
MTDQDNVRGILTDFEQRILSILEKAWAEWLEMPKKGKLSARSRASVVFDFIKNHAIDEFHADPNIHVIPKGQTVKFLFRDQVLVRFKKANSKGIGSNIETQAVLQFVDPQISIPNFLPDIYKIEVCYVLDRLATKMEMIAVTKRDRRRKIWSYPIHGSVADNVIHLPHAPPSGGSDEPPIVRPRTTPIEKPETGE